MKSNPSSNIEGEDEDINIMSNGKDIRSLKRHGNPNRHFPTMAICYRNTNNDINSEIKPSKLQTCHAVHGSYPNSKQQEILYTHH